MKQLPTPKPVEAVVSIPIQYAGSDAYIRHAEALARKELSDLAHTQDRELEIVDLELVESGPHYFLPTEKWSYLFRATPVWRAGARARIRKRR